MRSLTYLIFNLLVFIPVLVLSFRTDVKPHKHWRALLLSYLLVSVPFIVWDIWAASAGHWGFSSVYISDVRWVGIPPEEYLFFFTVPFALIYCWGVIKKFCADRPVGPWWPLTVLAGIAGLAVYWLVLYWSNGYTRSAAIMAIVTVLVASFSRLIFTFRFWIYQLTLLGLFVLANLVLTALPVITYGEQSIIGTRFITIPLEDFLFNFSLGTLFLLCFNYFSIKRGL
jgi:lycopene cyclase domain-containing protein